MKAKKYKIYLDTSIISAYFDFRKPVRQLITEKWIDKESSNYQLFISTLVLEEIDKNKDVTLRFRMLKLINELSTIVLEIDYETQELATNYRKEILFNETNDTLHIAVASVNRINAIVSWNFKHIVNLKTIETIHSINIKYRYPIIEVVSVENLGGYKYGNL